LVEGARLPDPASLPEELRALCQRNACELSDLRWAFDVRELIKDLEQVVELHSNRCTHRITSPLRLRNIPNVWYPVTECYTNLHSTQRPQGIFLQENTLGSVHGPLPVGSQEQLC